MDYGWSVTLYDITRASGYRHLTHTNWEIGVWRSTNTGFLCYWRVRLLRAIMSYGSLTEWINVSVVTIDRNIYNYIMAHKLLELVAEDGQNVELLVISCLFTMTTSSNGNIFRVTGHLRGEFTGPPVNSPYKGQWRGGLMFSLICVWINDWVNNGEAGDLRRYRIHYDVTVMRPHDPMEPGHQYACI